MPKLIVNDPVAPVARPQAGAADFGAAEATATRQLGRQITSTGQVLNAALEQRARVGASRYRNELAALQNEVLANPDMEAREELYEQGKRRLRQKNRTGSFAAYDRDASLVEGRIDANFRHLNRLQMVQQGQSDLADSIADDADEWAQAEGDPDLRAAAEARAMSAIDAAVASGLIDERMREESIERFRRIGRRAEFGRLLREDPEQAVASMAEPIAGIPEGERQELLTRAVRAHEATLRQERLADLEIQKAEQAEADARKEQIEIELVEADARGELTVALVQSVTDILGSDDGRLWLDRARSGSGTGGAGAANQTDRELYIDLDARARAGDPTVHADIRSAYRDDRLNKSTYDDLTDDELSARWGRGRKHLYTALDPGEVILSDARAASVAAARRAQAEREFDLFRETNPDAPLDEVMRTADHIARTAQDFDIGGVAAFNLRPESLVRTDDKIDFVASRQAIKRGVVSEGRTQAWAERELRLLDNLQRIEAKSREATER